MAPNCGFFVNLIKKTKQFGAKLRIFREFWMNSCKTEVSLPFKLKPLWGSTHIPHTYPKKVYSKPRGTLWKLRKFTLTIVCKNFVKVTFLLKKLPNSWFDEFFFGESKYLWFPVCEAQCCKRNFSSISIFFVKPSYKILIKKVSFTEIL